MSRLLISRNPVLAKLVRAELEPAPTQAQNSFLLPEQGLGRPLARFDRSIDVHLSSIRHKLGTLADGRSCIQTVYRLGYQFIKE